MPYQSGHQDPQGMSALELILPILGIIVITCTILGLVKHMNKHYTNSYIILNIMLKLINSDINYNTNTTVSH